MEDVLEVYKRPYNPARPVVCLDESSKQLVGEVVAPLPPAPGRPAIVDDEYVRNGVASVFLEVEPLAGVRNVGVTERRTRADWARYVKEMLDVRYPDAERVVLVMDNLNIHCISSLYEAFDPAEALRLARRLEIHHTPKHGSWLNIAEIELSALKRQCLPERVPQIGMLREMSAVWNIERNNRKTTIDWQFKTEDARIKLKRLYPNV
jgi:hypothetical protein